MSEPSRDKQLEAILHSYLQAVDAGENPDREELLRRHPDFADELREFFADQAKMDGMAKALNQAHASDITLGAEEARASGLPRIRYFGDYELLEEIGRGGMGVVYKARQVSLNRIVALKMILAGELAAPADVLRFRTEAEAAARLDHANIVPIYEVGEHEGQHFFSMKLVEGGSLAGKLASGQWLVTSKKGQQAAARLVATVARAVHHAHQRGILHRDLKPANLLLDAQEGPHVTDFGLARHVEGSSGQTKSGDIVGTPSYMPPEQARGERALSTAVDVYSLGAILYEMLAGRPPFRGDTPMQTLLQILEMEPVSPASVNRQAAIGRNLETICLKCLNKDPARRYGSAEMLAEDLERWLRGEPILARPAGRIERFGKWVRRKPAQAALLAVSLAASLMLFFAGLWFTKELRNERDNVERSLNNSYIMLAENAWNHAGTAELARDFLEKVPPVFRNWEWHFLHRKYQAGLFTIYAKSGECLAWSPLSSAEGGSRLASAGGDSIWILDARTGQTLLEFDRQDLQVNRLVWSPATSQHGGNRIAGALGGYQDKPGLVRIWDAGSGKVLLEIKEHISQALDVAWSPEGGRLATTYASGNGLDERTVRVWDATSGKNLLAIKTAASHVAWSPDGSRLATSNAFGVELWDAKTGGNLQSLRMNTSRGTSPIISCVSFSPEGGRVAAALQDGKVLVWDVPSGKMLHEFKGHSEHAWSVAWSPDGTRLASASHDMTVRIWDARTGEALLELKGHRGPVKSVCWSDDGRRVASASEDGAVRIWDARSDEELRAWFTLDQYDPTKMDVAWQTGSNRYAVASYDTTVRVWEVDSDQPVLEIQHAGVDSVAFSPDDSRLACAGGDDKSSDLKICDASSGQILLELKGHTKRVRSVAWSADGARLVSSSADNTVRIWDAGSGETLLEIKEFDGVGHVCWSPDGSRIAACRGDIRVWDAKMGKVLLELRGPNTYVNHLAWSRDGSRIAGAAGDRTVRIWDAKTGQQLLELTGHAREVECVCWHPDGSRLASGSLDKTARVWDAVTGQALLVFRGHGSAVMSVAWSPDGTRILSGEKDSRVHVWDARPRKVPHELRGHSGFKQAHFWSPDGSRLITYADSHFTAIAWDVATGTRIPGKADRVSGDKGGDISPDGKYWVGSSGPIVILGTTQLDEEERKYRLWLTRPNPQWHAQKCQEFQQENEEFAAAIHKSLEQRARGLLAKEKGDAAAASALFAEAAKLRPMALPPVKVPEPGK